MREQIQNKESTIELKRCDVRELSTCFENASIDAIVTEPYLGPLQTSRPLHKEIQKIVGELSSLYLGAFREFKKVLKPNDGRVVMVWPAFHTFFLPILDQVERLGFRVVEPLLPELSSLNLPELTSRGSIIYSRPDQHVLREIFVFQLWH
jgi:tRNA G10  N-methylase Trm11